MRLVSFVCAACVRVYLSFFMYKKVFVLLGTFQVSNLTEIFVMAGEQESYWYKKERETLNDPLI